MEALPQGYFRMIVVINRSMDHLSTESSEGLDDLQRLLMPELHQLRHQKRVHLPTQVLKRERRHQSRLLFVFVAAKLLTGENYPPTHRHIQQRRTRRKINLEENLQEESKHEGGRESPVTRQIHDNC